MSAVRLVAAILVALGLLLPLSTCTKGDPPVTEYHYAIADAVDNPSCEGACRAAEVGLSLATFLWPLLACLAARRFTGRKGTLARLCLEPLLLGGSAWWLYWRLLLEDPAAGAVAAFTGYVVYALLWAAEAGRLVRERMRLRAAAA